MYESRLDKTMEDSKYWLEKYTDSFREHDKNMNGLRTELNGRFDNIRDQLSGRVSVRDMELNFKVLNDLLFVKFSQIEDTKSGLRDVLAFQKHFYPI